MGDIKVGDEVFFNRKGIDNYNLYWEVIAFEKNMIEVKVNQMGDVDQLFIDFKDVMIVQ